MAVLALCMVATLSLTGCKKDKSEPTVNVSDSDVIGFWQKNGTAEYWRYRDDHTGCKYNTDEGFSEEFPSYSFSWRLSGSQLWHDVDEQGVTIHRVYTIKEISSTTMVREEEVSTFTLVKR